MMASNIGFSTHEMAFFARAKVGYAISEGLYVGPEFTAIGGQDTRQQRAGLHLTGLKIGGVQFGFAAGFARDRRHGNGAYATISSRVTF